VAITFEDLGSTTGDPEEPEFAAYLAERQAESCLAAGGGGSLVALSDPPLTTIPSHGPKMKELLSYATVADR